MKRNICQSVLILSILLVASCHRSKSVDDKKVYSDSLQGAWELRNVFGGFRPAGSPTNFAPGNGTIWSFKDSSFKRYEKGTLVDSGGFIIDRDTCPVTNTLMDAISFRNNSNNYGFQIFFEISRDTLTMYHGVIAADGTISKYVRINKLD